MAIVSLDVLKLPTFQKNDLPNYFLHAVNAEIFEK